MSLNYPNSYRYTNTDAFRSGVNFFGESKIFPNRPDNEKRVIRAEDYLYLIEGIRERYAVGTSQEGYARDNSVLPSLTSTSLFLENAYAMQRLKVELNEVLEKYALKPEVDELMPMNTVKTFNSRDELNAFVRSLMHAPTVWPQKSIGGEANSVISIEEMATLYNDLKRANTILKSTGGVGREGRFQVCVFDYRYDRSTGTFKEQFSVQIDENRKVGPSNTSPFSIIGFLEGVSTATSELKPHIEIHQVISSTYDLPLVDIAKADAVSTNIWLIGHVIGRDAKDRDWGLNNGQWCLYRRPRSYYSPGLDFKDSYSPLLAYYGFDAYATPYANAKKYEKISLDRYNMWYFEFNIEGGFIEYLPTRTANRDPYLKALLT